MEAIVKRAIERRLEAKGMSHKQALFTVSTLSEVVRDLRAAGEEIEQATAHVSGDNFRPEVPRG